VRGVQKHDKRKNQKVYVENFFRENSHYLAMGVQKYYKNSLQKNRFEKFLQTNRQKTQNRLFLNLFLCFGAFLGEGSSKTR
jgi:hypothetical protein